MKSCHRFSSGTLQSSSECQRTDSHRRWRLLILAQCRAHSSQVSAGSPCRVSRRRWLHLRWRTATKLGGIYQILLPEVARACCIDALKPPCFYSKNSHKPMMQLSQVCVVFISAMSSNRFWLHNFFLALLDRWKQKNYFQRNPREPSTIWRHQQILTIFAPL